MVRYAIWDRSQGQAECSRLRRILHGLCFVIPCLMLLGPFFYVFLYVIEFPLVAQLDEEQTWQFVAVFLALAVIAGACGRRPARPLNGNAPIW